MKFEIINNDLNREISLEIIKNEDGILYLSVKMIQQKEYVPEAFSVKFGIPSSDCYSVWHPAVSFSRSVEPEWMARKISSRLAQYMPVLSVISLKGRNKITVSVSDAVSPVTISAGVREEDAVIYTKVEFFTIPVAPLKEYSAILRVDTRDILYYESIYSTVSWWENECGYIPASIPEHAKFPMNSLWYSYHQMLDCEDILKECALSKELGMETVIIDDGWQTDDNNRGYRYCGDWEVAKKKIPDMREFVDKIHQTGMKVILWYSVPFVGICAGNFERFKDMMLGSTSAENDVWILDPRYKEVREFLIEQYKNALISWGLDGLKLDFIDSFVLSDKSVKYDERMDYRALEDAIDALMTDVTDALRKVNSEVLIEFRQAYVGPAIRKYGNMLRVRDCPNDAMVNRVHIVDLRLTSGNTPVHSDMLMWNYDDSVESAAIQIANSLYSVPQISMKIQHLKDEHKKMLSLYLKFWRDNADVLLNGKLTANNPEACYSLVCAEKCGKAIYTVYTERVISSKGEKETVAVNASSKEELYLTGFKGKSCKVVNCMGEETEKRELSSDFEIIKVPLCGMVFIALQS